MEIIIGREEGARRLHCIVGGREFNIGQAGAVPLVCKSSALQDFSQWKQYQHREHKGAERNLCRRQSGSQQRYHLEQPCAVRRRAISCTSAADTATGWCLSSQRSGSAKRGTDILVETHEGCVGGIRQPQNEDTERCCKICEQTTSARSILHVWYVSRLYSWHRPYNTHYHHCCRFVHRYIFLYKRKRHCNRSTTVARPRR